MATSNPSFNAFNGIDRSNSTVYRNRNGEIQLTSSALPATCGQHWIPSLDNTYDLGENSTPKRWRDIWISRNASVVGSVTAGALTVANNAIFTNGNVYIGGNGLSNYNSNTPNIGTNGSGRWGALWITTINTTGLVTAAAINVSSLAVSGTQPAMFSGFLLPSNSGALDLGSSALSWRDLYITGNIYKNGVLYNPGVTSLGDLLPGANNTYNIGSTSFRWKDGRFDGNIYCNNLFATNDITQVFGNLNVANGSGSFGTDVTIGATGSGTLSVIGSMIMVGNNQLRPNTSGFGSVGTSAIPWGNVYTLNDNANIVAPIVAGVPTVGTSVGTSGNQYQNGYIYNLNSLNVVPVGAGGALGATGNRWNNVWANNVTAGVSLTAPSTNSLDWSTFTSTMMNVALGANQIPITTSNILGVYMGSPVELGAGDASSIWKWALNQTTTITDTSADGRYCVFSHELRTFPYGTGVICFLKMQLKVNSFSAGGGVPTITPFFIGVQYKVPGITKTQVGQWCGTAQYLQWGQYNNNNVAPSQDAMIQSQRFSWFQRQGLGGVVTAGADGRVAIYVEPYSNSEPALSDRFTITATFFV